MTTKPTRPTMIHNTHTVAGLKAHLDTVGSAYDQVTRERVDNLPADVSEIKHDVERLSALAYTILTGVILNLLALAATLVVFILNRTH